MLLYHVQYNINWVCEPVTVVLTSALTTLKLIMVKYHLRTGAWFERLGHNIGSFLWLVILGWGLRCFTALLVIDIMCIVF